MIAPQLEIVLDADLVVAKLRGDVDLTNADAISTRILEAIPHEASGLIVDLSAVRYLDSRGVHMLFRFVRRLRASSQKMAVALGEDSPIHALLKITNIHEAVGVYPSQQHCVTVLRGSQATT